MPLGLAVEPHLRRAAAFDDIDDLLIDVLFRIECAGRRHLDHVAAPFPLGAVKLDIAALAAGPLPRTKRQVLDAAHADAAEDRHSLALPELVVAGPRAPHLSQARPL